METLNPRSDLIFSVSIKVLMTVLKMTADKGSPWYTPMPRGMVEVVQSLLIILADNPEYIVVLQGEINEVVMDTTICVSQAIASNLFLVTLRSLLLAGTNFSGFAK